MREAEHTHTHTSGPVCVRVLLLHGFSLPFLEFVGVEMNSQTFTNNVNDKHAVAMHLPRDANVNM